MAEERFIDLLADDEKDAVNRVEKLKVEFGALEFEIERLKEDKVTTIEEITQEAAAAKRALQKEVADLSERRRALVGDIEKMTQTVKDLVAAIESHQKKE